MSEASSTIEDMFDTDVSDLDAAAVADRLLASTRAVMAAEAEQLVLATHWVDLHAPEFVAGCEALLPGAERSKRVGADGCPEMSEFAGAELAVYLGRSTASGETLIADAVNLRHRHPLLWRALRQGEVRVWLAVQVARRCAAAGLSAEQALWVDAQVMPSMSALPTKRFLALVDAKIVEADPDGARARAEAEELARFVRVGRADEHGLRTLVARARGGDVLVLVAVLDRLAMVLADQGDTDPLDVRRATALRILADPARALALLAGAALQHLDDDETTEGASPASDPAFDLAVGHTVGTNAGTNAGFTGTSPGTGVTDGDATGDSPASDAWATRRSEAARGERPEEWAGWMLDAQGRPLRAGTLYDDLVDLEPETGGDLFEGTALELAGPVPAPERTIIDGGSSGSLSASGAPDDPLRRPPDGPDPSLAGLGDRRLLRRLVDTLTSTPVRMDPLCVINVHTTRAALRDSTGVARVEELGPQSMESVRLWLGAQGTGLRIRVRPVVDPDQIAPVDRYEIPAAMRHGVEVVNPFEVFPFGTRASSSCDEDHVRPFRRRSDGTPAEPGQTRPDNLAPASRFHHRLKTHGSWLCWSPEPGSWWWRTPQGHWFVVGPDGTHHVGRNADLDERRLWA